MRMSLIESINHQRMKGTKPLMDVFSDEYAKIDDERVSGREVDISAHFKIVNFEKGYIERRRSLHGEGATVVWA